METKTERSGWIKNVLIFATTLAIIFAIGLWLAMINTPLDQISFSMILSEVVAIAIDLTLCLSVAAITIGAIALLFATVVLIGKASTKVAGLFRRGK